MPKPPFAKPGPAPLPAALGGAFRLRDPYRELAEQRAKPLLGPALAPTPPPNPKAEAAFTRALADLAFKEERYTDAEAHFAAYLKLAPDDLQARHHYAASLFRQSKEALAIPHAQLLLERDPSNNAYRIMLAASYAMIGDFARSVELYELVLQDDAGQDTLWLNYGQALVSVGRAADAAMAYRKCLALEPTKGHAWATLGNLSAAAPPQADIAAMRTQLKNPGLKVENRAQFHYALGAALEKSAEYAESFEHYAEGARLWRSQVTYSADETTAHIARTKAIFSPGLLAAKAGGGCTDPAPIFIVGLPRAGSTLIEQILASHSEVEGTVEMSEMGHIVDSLGGQDAGAAYQTRLAASTPAELAALGERYIERTRIYRRLGRRYFIDKMPGNFVSCGLIQMILPNAKIIDARRDAMGNCFGAFKKSFAAGQPFTYDQTELGRYYNDYLDAMAYFDTAMPGRVHRVLYETMVGDTEAEVRRLLAYCGLQFEPGCLRFWENRRSVSTVSVAQVRRPIYREGLDHWRHYEPWLGPLKQALGLAGEAATAKRDS
jgi:tetratricopeptide (TPR) repeat protein